MKHRATPSACKGMAPKTRRKMKQLLTIMVALIAVSWTWARDEAQQKYVQVDWYPLLTDSVGWNIYSGGLGLGWVDATSTPASFKTGRSLELQWLTVVGAKYNTGRGQRITAGIGIDWRNYHLGHDERFSRATDGSVAVSPYPDGSSSRSSRLRTFSLTVPVIFRQRIGASIDVAAGVVTDFNVHASIATKYNTDAEGKIRENASKHMHQVPVTFDLMTGLSYRHVGAYLKYSPCRVLKKGWGPDIKPLSAGIVIGL